MNTKITLLGGLLVLACCGLSAMKQEPQKPDDQNVNQTDQEYAIIVLPKVPEGTRPPIDVTVVSDNNNQLQ
jgi:hypothetical protein